MTRTVAAMWEAGLRQVCSCQWEFPSSPVAVHKSSHRVAFRNPCFFLGFSRHKGPFTKVMFYAHRNLCKSQHRGAAHLARGADLNWIPGWEKRTPLDAASRSRAEDVAAWLRSQRAKSAGDIS